jgi:hypothetical protein
VENRAYRLEGVDWKSLVLTEDELFLGKTFYADSAKMVAGGGEVGILRIGNANVISTCFTENNKFVSLEAVNDLGQHKNYELEFSSEEEANEVNKLLGNHLKLNYEEKEEKVSQDFKVRVLSFALLLACFVALIVLTKPEDELNMSSNKGQLVSNLLNELASHGILKWLSIPIAIFALIRGGGFIRSIGDLVKRKYLLGPNPRKKTLGTIRISYPN